MTTVLRPEKLKESAPEQHERTAPKDVREAITATYPHEDGLMVAKLVSSRKGISWYRVNWYRSNQGGQFIDRSRFVAVSRTNGTIKVEDQTVRTPGSVRFN